MCCFCCPNCCWCDICSCGACDCGCEGDVVTDECCLNNNYYALVEGTNNSYVEFGFGYVLGTDSPNSTYIAQGVISWYFGNNADASTIYTALPSGGCIVASAVATNCACSALDFGYGDCPFYDSCNGGKWPENPSYVNFGQQC
jgi:hypothetical protein